MNRHPESGVLVANVVLPNGRESFDMRLGDLLPPDAEYDRRFAGLTVTGLTADSRKVRPGNLFVAVPGTRTDGLAFVEAAVRAGAIAVAAQRPPTKPLPECVPLIRVSNARRALALAASRFHPGQPATIAAVTGTSGKTSVAAFTRQIWSALGRSAASIGTVGLVSPTREVYGALTTPDPIELHRTLDALAGEGVTHLAIEASSHGLDQYRLDGVRIAVAGFTNISRDHLDYHPSLEHYVAAKLRLFEELLDPQGTAVIHVVEAATPFLAAARARKLKLMTVGRGNETIRILRVAIDGFAQHVELAYTGKIHVVRLPLVGAFQVENAAVAAGLAIASGERPAEVFAALEGLQGAKGRLELVGTKGGAPVFVDYAHKPDALAKALEALRPYTRGRLLVVFGAGGDRDKGKRPMMGAIAAEKADRVIVTDDNPRSEDPAAIRRDILAACPGAAEIGDRAAAIRQGIAELGPGDVLLIAGKGHETGQIIGDRVLPFSDQEEVKAALRETLG
jgi:UDP-N-acetylmuramoyl-L-alanyl-D-glutamate--2,6-diaminopimelate ligase